VKLKPKSNAKPARRRAPETIRERATKQTATKQPRNSKLRSKIHRPLSVLRRAVQKEFHPVKLPQNRVGKFLSKRFNLIPGFLVNAWKELRLVNWPSRKDAIKLTFAVIVFAAIFAVFVQVFGILFERLFKYIFTT
jgi:preprotein translocase SecE subunit